MGFCITMKDWMDTGYPKGIKNEKISLIGKILAVADTVEAITNKRPYRRAVGLVTALGILKEEKNKTYDSKTVEACQQVFEKGFVFPKLNKSAKNQGL